MDRRRKVVRVLTHDAGRVDVRREPEGARTRRVHLGREGAHLRVRVRVRESTLVGKEPTCG